MTKPNTKTALIIGATSSIAEALAKRLAKKNYQFVLAARNLERLQQVKNNLQALGAKHVDTFVIDFNQLEKHAELITLAQEKLGIIDISLIAHGTCPDQQQCEQDSDFAMQHFSNNSTSVIGLLMRLAKVYQQQKHGTIAVISSVAGDRGRKSNYLYGSSKAALSIFCEGLNARLAMDHVNVLTVKPGLVDTPMTAHLEPKNFLWANSNQVAKDIERAINKKKKTLYTPWFWRWIMLIVRLIPIKI